MAIQQNVYSGDDGNSVLLCNFCQNDSQSLIKSDFKKITREDASHSTIKYSGHDRIKENNFIFD